MAAERPPPSEDPAEAVARVSAAKRDVLLRVHRHRLGFEDLEDCFSQATLELITRARTRARAFVSEAHIANALEQRFLSRINDRRRALSGRSPIQAATHAALRPVVDQEGGGEASPIAAVADPVADVAAHVADRDDVRRLRELADELTADQRLVLACQVALDMECQEFCARFGWSAEKFRKVAQRGRARLRVLVADYEAGGRCRGLADDLAAYVAHVAGGEQSERVRRHLSNCPACAQTARELERVARGVGALLPLPPTVDPEVVHRFGAVGRVLGRLLPFWDTGESVAAAKAGAAGAAAAAGGGGITAGGSVVGLGAAKLGVTALCVAGAAGGYVVCDQIGLFSGPLPRERHHIATTANAVRKAPPKRRAPSPAVTRAPAPITHTIRQPSATDTPSAHRGSSTPAMSPSHQASDEFGFEGAGGTKDSAPASSSPSSPSARTASAGAGGGADDVVGSAHAAGGVRPEGVDRVRVRVGAGRRVGTDDQPRTPEVWRARSGHAVRGPLVGCGRGDGAAVAGGRGRASLATPCPGGVGHRGLAASGVAERAGRHPEPALKRLDEVRGLAIAHQPCDIGHRERLVGEQLGRVAQPHGPEMGGKGRQADLVVGALELTWRGGQCLSQRGQGKRPPIATLDRDLCANEELGHQLVGGLAMGGAVPTTAWRDHPVLSDMLLRCGTHALTRSTAGILRRSTASPVPLSARSRSSTVATSPGSTRATPGSISWRVALTSRRCWRI